jgi:phage tail protein X
MSAREQLAGPAKIGPISFDATAASGSFSRRLVKYHGIGMDGAELDDLGEDARVETLRAELEEDVFIALEKLRRRGEKVACVHPLFGTMTARVEALSYDADQRPMVDCQITLVEDGYRPRPPQPVRVDAYYQANLAKAAAMRAGVEDWLNAPLPDLDADDALESMRELLAGFELGDWELPLAEALLEGFRAVEGFVDAMDDFISGFQDWEFLSGAYSVLNDSISWALGSFDTIKSAVESVIDFNWEDYCFDLLDSAQAMVAAATDTATQLWSSLTAKGPLTLDELAAEFLGTTDQEAIDAILANNPGLVDASVVPAGFEIFLPIWA